MTPPSDLPPSFTPDPSDPSGRRPARADAPPSSPPSGGARRGPAPQRRSLRTGPSADGGADSARPAPEGEGRRPARGAQAPGSSARGASHVRPGSSAMPLGGESAGGPGPARVMPAGSSGSSGAPSRGVFPVGTRPIPEGPSHPEVQPERAPLRPRRGRRPLRWVAAILVLLLVLVGGRAAWLWHDVDSKLQRVDALSGVDLSARPGTLTSARTRGPTAACPRTAPRAPARIRSWCCTRRPTVRPH